jgi:hypothetical protein
MSDLARPFQDLSRIASFDYPQAARIDREAFLPQFFADEDRLLARGQVAFKERESFADAYGRGGDDAVQPELVCCLPDAMASVVVSYVASQVIEAQSDRILMSLAAQIEDGGGLYFAGEQSPWADHLGPHAFDGLNEMPVSLDYD